MKLTPLEPWIADKIDHADLEVYQLRKLNETLRLAKEKSRFYREQLIDIPIDLDQLSDLNQLPFTTADDLRANPLAFVTVSQDEIQRVVTLDSSGTSGASKRLYFTRDDQELTIDFFHIGTSTFTEPGDRVLILLPGETPGSVGDLLALGLQRLGAIPIKHGPVRDTAATLDVLLREKIDVMVGVPTHVLALARQPIKSPLKLKSVLLSTDHVPSTIKHAIESAFSCIVYNHYGMTEMGLGGGVDCDARRGYHLREADLYFEIIDPVTGRVLPDGEDGEVVFTTLTRRGLPLIRYRTGDVSRFLIDQCPCGTRLKTLERITHRLDGRLSVGSGYLTMADLDEALFAIKDVLNFTATLSRDAGRDQLQVAVKTIGAADATPIVKQALAALPVLSDMLISVTTVQNIPPSMAKRTIVDQRGSA